MTPSFDVVYEDRKCMAPTDSERYFFSFDVGSLDAPSLNPAGSTRAHECFHATTVTYRVGS